MSYLNQAQDPRRRAAAIAVTAAIHGLIGVAIVTGLTVAGYTTIDKYEPILQFPVDKPKPPPPEPQPPRQQEQDSFVVVPPRPMPPLADPIDIEVRDPIVDPRPLVIDPRPAIVPVVEPPRPAFVPRTARPSNEPGRWLSNNDYPARPLRAGVEGIAAYRLIVGTNGRVTACEVTRSTGNGQLDEATCDNITRRARFDPATDETGAKVVGSYTGTVRWEIPE